MRLLALGLIAGALLLGSVCTPSGETEEMQKWRLRADRTLVCVDNRREYTLRVELMRDGTRHKVAQLNMRPFQEKCDWFPIVEGSLLNARIDWVGAVRDAYPPQWQGILNTGETLRLHVGVDGATPFAHSSVL